MSAPPSPPESFALETDDGPRLVIRHGRVGHPEQPAAFTVRLGRGMIHPGLINAHDHLYRNHYRRLGSPPYANAYEWGEDIHARHRDDIERLRKLPRTDALLFSALRNLLGAVTTVVHHDQWTHQLGGDFPVRVVRIRVAHSLKLEPDLPRAVTGSVSTRGRPFSMHLAEGTDPSSAAEVEEADRRGLLHREMLAVHVVGANRDGIERIRRAGAAVVWCPTSNLFLFGRTAPPELLRPGVDVLLGTDSLLTAAGTMLAELREARRLARLDDQRLRDAVGTVAARRLRVESPDVSPGAPADLAVLRKPLFEARPADVALVLVNGRPRLADEDLQDLFSSCRLPFETLDVGGVRKVVCPPLASVAGRVFELSPECRRILTS